MKGIDCISIDPFFHEEMNKLVFRHSTIFTGI